MITKITPFMNIGPGEFIREEMEIRGWNQKDLSSVLGISEKSVSKLVNDEQAITVNTAYLLGKAFGQSPDYWLNLYNNYAIRLLKDSHPEKSEVEIRSLIYNCMPINEMFHKGWLRKTRDVDELKDEVSRFCNLGEWNDSLFRETLFGKSEILENYRECHSLVWFHMAKKCCRFFRVGEYDKKILKQISRQLHRYTASIDGVKYLINDLEKAGVKFFVLSHLQKTNIDGASFFDGRNPVIVYTGNNDRLDNFWFTVAHEITHILKHLDNREDFFIDEIERNNLIVHEKECEQEKEADEFALNVIRKKEILNFFALHHYKTHEKIKKCEEELQVFKGIIVGILRQESLLSKRNLNRYSYKVLELIPDRYFVESNLMDVA